jgi:peptidyl-prolyl cis-trans isomerase C
MSDEILASHILIMYKGSARSVATRSKDEALELATGLRRKLDEGEDFETLARLHSNCSSSSRGGDLGLFGRGEMVPAFDKVAFSLPVDGMSEVVETEFGFHIIYRMA